MNPNLSNVNLNKTTSGVSRSSKPPLPFGLTSSSSSGQFSRSLIASSNESTPATPQLLSPRSILTHTQSFINDSTSSLSTSHFPVSASGHSRSPSSSSMLFGTIESAGSSNSQSSLGGIGASLSPGKPHVANLLNKTKSMDRPSIINTSAERSAKLKSASLSSNLSSHTGSMASKLNKDFPFTGSGSAKSNNSSLFWLGKSHSAKVKANTSASPNLGRGRSGSGSNAPNSLVATSSESSRVAVGPTPASDRSKKKKKISSALTLPSFLTSPKRHSIESLIEYCEQKNRST
jgi:hypothetical protein